jgi:biofilm PGA synthesis N-glycosyltransferase PgaC
MLLYIIFIFFILYTSLIFYYWHGWTALKNPSYQGSSKEFISIIIPVRNEEKNILALLHSLKNQTYPASLFEIILVDDFSTDQTATLINKCRLDNSILIQPADNINSSKKKAIAAGIQIARGKLIVTTDADCRPSDKWLDNLNSFYFSSKAEFIAAPVKMDYNNKLIEIFQALDFLTLQGITGASAYYNIHVMCNGANMAYSRKAFQEVNGYEGVDNVASGDDMFLMYKIKNRFPGKVMFIKSQDAIVSTNAIPDLTGFFSQRKRWASKAFVLKDNNLILILCFIYLFNCLLLTLFFSGFINHQNWLYFIYFLLFKTLIEWPFVYSITRFYNEKKLMWYFVFFQPFHILYTVVVGAISQFGTYNWKDRITR